jgi:hypothetical protein
VTMTSVTSATLSISLNKIFFYLYKNKKINGKFSE